MPGCCDPYCCVKTKKDVIKTTNYLEETYKLMQKREMAAMRSGAVEKPKMEPYRRENPAISTKYPTKGPLGLSQKERQAILDSWNSVEEPEAFITDYLDKVFERVDLRKPFLIPTKPPEGKTLRETTIFQRHVLLQHISFQAFMDQIVASPEKLVKVAQELGLRHQRFKSIVVFEKYVWEHLATSFLAALQTHIGEAFTPELKILWSRLLFFLFTHINMSFHYGASYSY